MKFQILIPTYNRCSDLKKNLEHLKCEMVEHYLTREFGIYVSDNASTDDTWVMLQRLQNEWKDEVKLDIVRNETNVGLEQNTVNLLSFATADYIIWLGDDDLLAEGYLKFINEKFQNGKSGWMVPGVLSIDGGGNIVDVRPANFQFREYSPGFDALYQVSHFGHQLSGLVLKRSELLEKYLSKPQWRNVYLFITFLVLNQIKYPGIYTPHYKTLVNNFNSKDWGYNEIGLLDEVFRAYYYLKDFIGQRNVNRLLLRFIVMHSYRINFGEGFRSVIRQWKNISDRANEARGIKIQLLVLMTKEFIAQKIKNRLRLPFTQ